MQLRGMQVFREILDPGPNKKTRQPVMMHFHQICTYRGCIYRGSTVHRGNFGGISTPYTYLALPGFAFTLHDEDFHPPSWNFMIRGPGPKIWFILPPSSRKRTEWVFAGAPWPTPEHLEPGGVRCEQYTRHQVSGPCQTAWKNCSWW